MAAERFEWIMKIILTHDGDGPFGIGVKEGITEAWCCSLVHASMV